VEIVLFPDPLLRRKAERVDAFDAALAALAREMFETMYRARGVGLAAPQVGVSRSLFVSNPTGDPVEKGEERVWVNPRILRRTGSVPGEEGCLSFPGIYAEVLRAESIVVEVADVTGKVERVELADFPARIVQHEGDHLEGVLFVDRLSPADRIRVKPALAALEERYKKGEKRMRPEAAEPEPAPGRARNAAL